MPGTILKEKPLDVAIIGGGITGVTLALGLHKRGINFTIYERASSFHEIGAGIGFTPNAERAMLALDERIHGAFRKVATQNSEDWFRWVDGYNYDRSNPGDMDEKPIFKLYLGERGFEGCRRSDFLQDLVSHIPEERVKFGKNLDSVTDNGDDEKLQLNFCDGTVEHTDIGESTSRYFPPNIPAYNPPLQSSAATASAHAYANSSSATTTQPHTRPTPTSTPSAASSPWTEPAPCSATTKSPHASCTSGPTPTPSPSP